MHKNSDDYLNFVMGTLTGVLCGVIAGMVFSPKPGVEVRKDIKKTVKRLTKSEPSEIDITKNTFYKSMDRLKYTVENQINKMNDAIKAGRMASAKRKEEMEAGY